MTSQFIFFLTTSKYELHNQFIVLLKQDCQTHFQSRGCTHHNLIPSGLDYWNISCICWKCSIFYKRHVCVFDTRALKEHLFWFFFFSLYQRFKWIFSFLILFFHVVVFSPASGKCRDRTPTLLTWHIAPRCVWTSELNLLHNFHKSVFSPLVMSPLG